MVIYKITNIINGKIYIGQTCEANLIRRFKAHFKKTRSRDLVRDAYNKYGIESLKFEVIYTAFDLDELNRAEAYFITKFNSRVPNGYNIQNGGSGKGMWDEETKKLNGKKVREYYKSNPHPLKGKKFTKEHVENLSRVRKGFDSENRKKARLEMTRKLKIPIIAVNLVTKEETVFESIKDCSIQLNLDPTNISRVLSGSKNRTQHKGYTFRYVNKENNQIQQKPDRELKYITPINKGGFAVKVGEEYIGWRKSLHEAKLLRDDFIKKKKKE